VRASYLKLIVVTTLLVGGQQLYGQDTKINWLNFEQLATALKAQGRPILIDFYADWCAYCRKMDDAAYADPEVIKLLNSSYYAVKMHAEAQDTVRFAGMVFKNALFGKSRRPTHELPLLLGKRDGRPFSLPLVIILNEDLVVRQRYFEYISPKRMKEILQD